MTISSTKNGSAQRTGSCNLPLANSLYAAVLVFVVSIALSALTACTPVDNAERTAAQDTGQAADEEGGVDNSSGEAAASETSESSTSETQESEADSQGGRDSDTGPGEEGDTDSDTQSSVRKGSDRSAPQEPTEAEPELDQVPLSSIFGQPPREVTRTTTATFLLERHEDYKLTNAFSFDNSGDVNTYFHHREIYADPESLWMINVERDEVYIQVSKDINHLAWQHLYEPNVDVGMKSHNNANTRAGVVWGQLAEQDLTFGQVENNRYVKKMNLGDYSRQAEANETAYFGAEFDGFNVDRSDLADVLDLIEVQIEVICDVTTRQPVQINTVLVAQDFARVGEEFGHSEAELAQVDGVIFESVTTFDFNNPRPVDMGERVMSTPDVPAILDIAFGGIDRNEGCPDDEEMWDLVQPAVPDYIDKVVDVYCPIVGWAYGELAVVTDQDEVRLRGPVALRKVGDTWEHVAGDSTYASFCYDMNRVQAPEVLQCREVLPILKVTGIGDVRIGETTLEEALEILNPILGQGTVFDTTCPSGSDQGIDWVGVRVIVGDGVVRGWTMSGGKDSKKLLMTPSGVHPKMSESDMRSIYRGVEIHNGSLGREFFYTTPYGTMTGILEDGVIESLKVADGCYWR